MKIDRFRVKEAMSKKGISTQTELASVLGITKHQLSVMLSSKYDPIKSNVINLCETLGVTPSYLLKDIEEEQASLVDETDNKLDFLITTAEKPTGIKTLELFAGAGGLALGLELSGLETEAVVEVDKAACETLKLNRPSWRVIHEDVRNVDFTQYKVDVVTGGFPCQAFSYAGKKLGFDDVRGTLFFEFARAIKEIRPKLFIGENVRGLINHDNGRTLQTIIDILSDLGYNVRYKLLNAVNYGVPQKRERIIIVGTLPEYEFNYPEPEERVVNLRHALYKVPISEGMQYSANRRRILEMVPPGGCWRDLPEDVQRDFMGKSYFSGGGRTGMARRLSWDEPSLTLTTSPSQKQTERCHPEEVRPFTVREYARIQTFPDTWEFYGTVSDKYRQIGNAVPVRLAYKLGRSIVEALQPQKSKVPAKKSQLYSQLEFELETKRAVVLT
ncbi:MAG TPA: DNA (cytosine-5-)-methyltransferase [Bacilli bacterium]|nr:DNA (cytosine-5-)-methyltransferase [Bacilli bacterium]